MAKYSYLADGTKISAMDSTGTCYRYYGPMVYTVGANGSKSLESVSIPTGRISSSGVLYHVTDHLGSVRAVVNGNTGALIETSNYSIYGARSAGFMSVTSSSPETRYRFTGKEDQSPAFGISYTDFGARHYSPNLRRWLVPDPLSEQYYDVSPYAYCAGDPVNLVDEDGRDFRKKRRFNTYTITAIYYVNNQESYKSTSQGISFWNRRTNDTYTDESGRTFNIKYNLTVRQIDQKHSPQLGDNTFEVNDERVKANDIDKKGIVGVTLNANKIYVKRNYSIKNPNTNHHSSTPAHEIGHTLGMKDKSSGIMSERQDEARTGMVSDDNIHEMMTSQSGEDEKIGILTTLYEKIRELF